MAAPTVVEEADPEEAEPMATRAAEVPDTQTTLLLRPVDYIGSSGRAPGHAPTGTSAPGGTWRAPDHATTGTSMLLK